MQTTTMFSMPGITAGRKGDIAADVRAGLLRAGQKELPSKYLYDHLGSALFEAICLLPEYGLNRAGGRVMRKSAEEITQMLPRPVLIAELGSGNGVNTRWLLEAFSQRQATRYFPIDISATALARCRAELGCLDSVDVIPVELSYLDGLTEVASRRGPGECLLTLFLGSTIGNFDRPEGELFLRQIREVLRPGDALLLATDLEKSIRDLLLAYDDPAGVTAAFNLNMLARINKELAADFDLANFAHQAIWDGEHRRIEMHLRSTVSQTVRIPVAQCSVSLAKGETIWTESCHKFNCVEVVRMANRAGFHCNGQWVDYEWPFAQSLLIAQ